MAELRNDFVNAARKYIGVKWRHQGRSKHEIDCVGLLVVSLRDIGINADDFTNYTRRPIANKFIDYFLNRGCLKVKKNEIKHGDILVFKECTYPCHVGIYANDKKEETFIHAHLPKRKTVEEVYTDEWYRKNIVVLTHEGFL